jgi:hypothetical protein
MTKLLPALALCAVAVAGCGGPSDPAGPPTLWLALNGDEMHVKLQLPKPNPY